MLPPWTAPTGGEDRGLKVYNSLTRSKVPFVPQANRTIKWYSCGPTVYDSSHLGHARSYVGFDIVRRIMQDYFGYDVFLVMNITDIDDKIIARSNELGIPFTELARKYEIEFLDNMKELGVLLPDVMTRVSEYMPEVVAFIETSIKRGYAYESGGSVYFDVKAFHAAKTADGHTHHYAKLEPSAVGHGDMQREAEASAGASDKKSSGDFALWKKAKAGEPSWDSPWGQGRPGWHVECSAMATDILGEVLDLHSGGCDLRFPHHDNELAQSEAYFDNGQWVNYFLHTGHLHIEGLKMSKSLKNFIKIDEALRDYSARQIRFFFLSYRFDQGVDFSRRALTAAGAVEKKFGEFFQNVRVVLRGLSGNHRARWYEAEKTLHAALQATRQEVHERLCDSLDTPSAMLALQALINKTNVYMAEAGDNPCGAVLHAIAVYITKILQAFGVVDVSGDFGFPAAGGAQSAEDTLKPFLDAFTQFRDTVRVTSRSKDLDAKQQNIALLTACDAIRDTTLPDLGVRIEDRGEASIWKLEDKEVLRKEREAKAEAEAAKAREKAAKAEARRKLQEEKEAKAKIDPRTMFVTQTDRFSLFDDKGIPTHDAKGEPLSKKLRKKVEKEYDLQSKSHEEWKAKAGEGTS